MKLFTAAQIREWDAYTIQHESISSLHLMERAAHACADWLLTQQPYQHEQPVHIFCGKGNNGGDGLAIARLLSEAGRDVTVYILEFGHKGTDDFQTNLQRLHQYPAVLIHFIQNDTPLPTLSSGDIIVDALYGSGLNRPLEGLSATLVAHLNSSKAPIIAIDVPSGMPIDTHASGDIIVRATHTLTFQSWKLAFLMPENATFTGQVTVLPIGLHPGYEQQTTTPYQLMDDAFAQSIYRPRSPFAHKGTFGHALLIAGSEGKTGACILSSRACLRSGAGLLTCFIAPASLPILQITVPEAMVMTQREEVATLSRITIGIGPGIGTTPDAKALLEWALKLAKGPMLIDADALNLLAAHPELWQHVPAGSVLTPHPKEFERLFGKTANDFERIALAAEQATQKNCYIVLKGHNSFVAAPGGVGWFNNTGNAGMATGGSGDVLSGIITGLLSQGYPPLNAAQLGVFLHGRSGDLVLQHQSQESLIAGDLVECLGLAFNSIAQQKD